MFFGVYLKKKLKGLKRDTKNFRHIANLPVLFDKQGGIGTPSSDEERTALGVETRKLFVNINAYTGYEDARQDLAMAIELCKQFLYAQNIDVQITE